MECMLALTVPTGRNTEKARLRSPWSALSPLRSVYTNDKVVALTYDDGPDPRYTRRILAVLRRHNVKATFFMIGKSMDEYPDIVRQAHDDGHVVANHTYTHEKGSHMNSLSRMVGELERCERTIERLTGERTYLFRPPRGDMRLAVIGASARQGYCVALWTVCANFHGASPFMMADRVTSRVRPGAIILAHDGLFESRWKDVVATELIIEGLEQRGYRFVTLPELLAGPVGIAQ